MMIKVGNEFLDFDDDIEMEKQIKLFEDISTTDGDYSYAFELEKSIHNTRLLQNPFPDNISKPVYQRIPAQLLGDSGAVTYEGYIRIQRITDVYECSFFSGNNNWFGMIDGLLTDIDFSHFDVEQTEYNIIASWAQSEGIIYPFLDNGALITRYYPQLKIEDFVGAFYIKTIFQKVFTNAGIKIQGELLEDWHYNNSICLKSSKDQGQINDRTSYVLKGTNQVIAHEFLTKVTYTDDFNYPYGDGSLNLFDLPNSKFVADVKMNVRVDSTLSYHTTGGGASAFRTGVLINSIAQTKSSVRSIEDGEVVGSFNAIIPLEAGDVLEIFAFERNEDGDAGTIVGGTVKITPTYIYKTFGNAAVPNWTSQQFVSNVLRIFNVLPSYNAGTATLTLNMFEKVRAKPPLDLSEFITDTEIDYQEFVSDYARKSRFTYEQVEFEELKSYNQGKFFKYGQGILNVDNGFLEEDKEILKSDFANPVDYILPVFSASVAKTNVIELEQADTVAFDDVADDGSGNAAFHLLSTNPFVVGDLIRISNSSNTVYNGDFIVRSIPVGHVVTDLPFDTAATGDITELNYKYSNDDDVFIMLNAPNYPVANFSGSQITFETENYPIDISTVALVWFNMISTGVQANHDFIYSLSFGRVDDPLAYQVPLIETHFRLFSQVLNDPVKLISTALVPYDVYMRIDFLRPITIKTFETTNQYYLNRVTGYKESYLDCQLELIKLPGQAVQIEGVTTGGATSGVGGGPAEDPEIPSEFGFPYIFDFELS